MSNLIVIAAGMHKIAALPLKVKCCDGGNGGEYIPVEFEIFVQGEYYKALPLHSREARQRTNLPDQLLFQIKNGTVYNDSGGTDKVVEDLVNQLIKMKIAENPEPPLERQGHNIKEEPSGM
jgi:hypothetical protein